jgi:hypothetical protein
MWMTYVLGPLGLHRQAVRQDSEEAEVQFTVHPKRKVPAVEQWGRVHAGR